MDEWHQIDHNYIICRLQGIFKILSFDKAITTISRVMRKKKRRVIGEVIRPLQQW